MLVVNVCCCLIQDRKKEEERLSVQDEATPLLEQRRTTSLADLLASLWASLQDVLRLFQNKLFAILALSGGFQMAVYGGWSGVLTDSLTSTGYSDAAAGWAGFANTMASILGGLVCGLVTDIPTLARKVSLRENLWSHRQALYDARSMPGMDSGQIVKGSSCFHLDRALSMVFGEATTQTHSAFDGCLASWGHRCAPFGLLPRICLYCCGV